MIIAFIGNNGAGKTTVTKNLVSIFTGKGKRAVLLEGASYFLIGFLRKIFPKNNYSGERASAVSGRPGFWTYLWTYAVFMDSLFACVYLFVASRRSLIVLDRYFYDYIVTFKDLSCLSPLSEFLFMSLPKPDYIFLIDAPAETCALRRDNGLENTSFYQRRREDYLDLSKRLRIETISGIQAVQDICGYVSTKIGL